MLMLKCHQFLNSKTVVYLPGDIGRMLCIHPQADTLPGS